MNAIGDRFSAFDLESFMNSGFDWDDMRFFLAVARTGKISIAARTLGRDHTTVGRRLQTLEEALGTKLFHRSNSGFTLTTKGQALRPLAEAMEREALRAQGELFGGDSEVAGKVRIGAPDGFSSFFIAPRMGQFNRLFPNVEIQIIAMPRVFSLSKREVDIAISLTRPTHGRLVARKITDYKLGLFASVPYLSSAPRINDVASLIEHPFIGYTEEHIFSPQLNYLRNFGPKIRMLIKSSNLIAQLNAAKAGAGLCVLPYFLAREEPLLKQVLRTQFELKRTFWLTIHEDQKKLGRINALADFICAEAKRAGNFFLADD